MTLKLAINWILRPSVSEDAVVKVHIHYILTFFFAMETPLSVNSIYDNLCM